MTLDMSWQEFEAIVRLNGLLVAFEEAGATAHMAPAPEHSPGTPALRAWERSIHYSLTTMLPMPPLFSWRVRGATASGSGFIIDLLHHVGPVELSNPKRLGRAALLYTDGRWRWSGP